MNIDDPILFKINDDPMSRARVVGRLVEDLGDELVIEYEGKTYRRREADCLVQPLRPQATQ